jgi:hypothetical protein
MSSTTLKLIALLFMLLDHIAEFIPGTPEWLHWIGRLSAPIFFFCMAWGFHYTQNRKKYLLRMYLCGVFMSIINIIVQNIFQSEIENNIFVTLFVSSLLIYIIDTLKENQKKGIKLLVCFILWQIVNTCVILYFEWFGIFLNDFMGFNFYTIFANCFFNEGGIMFVMLGVLLYYTKDNKHKLAITYICFSFIYTILYATNIAARVIMKSELFHSNIIYNIVQFILCGIFQANWFPIYGIRFYTIINYYWMVIGALPFMLMYNYKKGNGMKYFFYFFYPLHIYILYVIGNLIK